MIFNHFIKPSCIIRILSDPKKHWSLNRVSFAYLSNASEESIINFHHNDCAKCSIIDDLHLNDTLYTFPEIVDPGSNGEEIQPSQRGFRNAEMVYWFNNGKRLELEYDWTIRQYHSIDVENVNDAIPIMRWVDWCRKMRDATHRLVINDPALDEYERFALNLRSIEKKYQYGHYNPYTTTGRPSNHFDGINFAALSTNQRKQYRTKYVNGFLIDIDLSSFHLHLLYSIIGLNIPDDIYKSLGHLYDRCGCSRDIDAKEFTFRQIYGGIDDRLINQTPFKEIDRLADSLFDTYKSGNLTTLLHGRKFIFPSGLSKWKILNYCLQSLETEHNMILIDRCLRSDLNLILYTYDSFLFDVEAIDVNRTIKLITEIFSDLAYKIKIGRNYGEMRSIGYFS